MKVTATDYLGRRWRCAACGQARSVPTRWVEVAEGVLAHLPDTIPADATPLVVADEIAWEVAVRTVAHLLQSACPSVRTVVLPIALHATDKTAEFLMERLSTDITTALAVGSGAVNDVVKWGATQRAVPYITVPTAASVNGYTSPIAALTVDGVKGTLPCHPPIGVLAEPRTVASAPLAMTAAGYADLDWQVAHRLWDEPYCPLPRRLIAFADAWSLDHLRKLAASGQKAVAELLLALIAAGIGMTIAGSSAPSSGGEHLISHWLDIQADRRGRSPALRWAAGWRRNACGVGALRTLAGD